MFGTFRDVGDKCNVAKNTMFSKIILGILLRLIKHKLQMVIYQPEEFKSIFLEMHRIITNYVSIERL